MNTDRKWEPHYQGSYGAKERGEYCTELQKTFNNSSQKVIMVWPLF